MIFLAILSILSISMLETLCQLKLSRFFFLFSFLIIFFILFLGKALAIEAPNPIAVYPGARPDDTPEGVITENTCVNKDKAPQWYAVDQLTGPDCQVSNMGWSVYWHASLVTQDSYDQVKKWYRAILMRDGWTIDTQEEIANDCQNVTTGKSSGKIAKTLKLSIIKRDSLGKPLAGGSLDITDFQRVCREAWRGFVTPELSDVVNIDLGISASDSFLKSTRANEPPNKAATGIAENALIDIGTSNSSCAASLERPSKTVFFVIFLFIVILVSALSFYFFKKVKSPRKYFFVFVVLMALIIGFLIIKNRWWNNDNLCCNQGYEFVKAGAQYVDQHKLAIGVGNIRDGESPSVGLWVFVENQPELDRQVRVSTGQVVTVGNWQVSLGKISEKQGGFVCLRVTNKAI